MRAMLRAALFLCALAIGSAEPAHAQSTDTTTAAGSALTVYLVTIEPGDAIWERFGHNALWIHDAAANTNIAYNYGMFSFDQPGFIGRLMRGDMLYWMQPMDADAMIFHYAQQNRTVVVQSLDLLPQERAELQAFLEWNAQPENAYYTYHPFRDNCSTRVRDAIDRATGGQLQTALGAQPTDRTFRSESLRLLARQVAASTGLLLALGQPTDEPLSEWEAAFIPMSLRESVQSMEIRRRDGTVTALVAEERVLSAANRAAELDSPPQRIGYYLAAGVAIAVLFLALGHVMGGSRLARAAFAAVSLLWALALGVLGAIITLLWAATSHSYTYANENLLLVNPLPLALLLLLPVALFGAHPRTRWAARVAAGIAGLAALAFLLQALPGLDQQNGEIIALLLPGHLALAVVMYLWHRGAASAPRDA